MHICTPPLGHLYGFPKEEKPGDEGGHPPVRVDVVGQLLQDGLLRGERLKVQPRAKDALEAQEHDARAHLMESGGGVWERVERVGGGCCGVEQAMNTKHGSINCYPM